MDVGVLVYCVACVFGAAIVRGYSGFGFSLLAITSLTLALPPVAIIPSIFMLELCASAHLLPGIWRQIDWRAILWLMLGTVVGTPIGAFALAHVPAEPMVVAMSIIVLGSTLLLSRGFGLKRSPGPAATTAVGTATGVLNGAFGFAGPPVILFFLGTPAGAAVGRASIIAYFIGTDSYGLAVLGWNDLVGFDHVLRTLAFLPPLLAGVWLGARSFRRADPATFRRWVLRILMLLAVLTGLKGAWAMLSAVPAP
jgi:hypothetical protein